MSSMNPATLAASRAMLTRNNSSQSTLSAAAAAAALKRASSQTQLDRHVAAAAAAGVAAAHDESSPRPGLRRRTSSMSERSFRSQTPADHARERRERPGSLGDTTPEKGDKGVKRRGSFTFPGLRGSSKQKTLAGGQTGAPGIIQPLPQQTLQQSTSTTTRIQTQSRSTTKPQHKLKTSMRGSGGGDRDRPLSPPTHSAMRLPHQPGIGSSASSIRSFQTDLSSIAEDQVIDYSQGPPNSKIPSHLFPMKSALKGGSGPPSIISEAISEESRSSLGTYDKKQKARVSFSDEQDSGPQIMQLGQKEGTKEGFLKPENAVLLGRGVTSGTGVVRSGSPPLSPPLSPQVAVAVPAKGSARTLIPSGNVPVTEGTSSLTPASTLQDSPLVRDSTPPSSSQSKEVTRPLQTTLAPISVHENPIPVITQSDPGISQPSHSEVSSKESTSQSPSQSLQSPTSPTPQPPQTTPITAPTTTTTTTTSPIPQVTIRVPPTLNRSKSRLPGSFPDPTPDPTPPQTADSTALSSIHSAVTAAETLETNDILSPLPISRTQTPDLNNDLDLQRGLSLRTMNLIPTSPVRGNLGRFVGPSQGVQGSQGSQGSQGGLLAQRLSPQGSPEMVRRISSESAGSGMSVYSDAVDDLGEQPRERTPRKEIQEFGGEMGKSQNVLVNAWNPVVQEQNDASQVGPSIPSDATQSTTTTTSKVVSPMLVTTQPPIQEVQPSKPPGTTIPLSTPLTSSDAKPPFRQQKQNGLPRTLRTSSIQPPSPTTANTLHNSLPAAVAATTIPPRTTTVPISGPSATRPSSVPPPKRSSLRDPPTPSTDRKPMRMSLRQTPTAVSTATTTTTVSPSIDMARGLMSLPRLERVPSDSSFKRRKPRGETTFAKTLRSPKQSSTTGTESARLRRRDSSSSDELAGVSSKSGFFSRLRRGSMEQSGRERPTFGGSRFMDSSDEEGEGLARPAPRRLESSMTAPVVSTAMKTTTATNAFSNTSSGIRKPYTESLPPTSPAIKKRSSFSQLFKRHGRRDSKVSIPETVETTAVGTSGAPSMVTESGHGRSKSASIFSKRTGKEKRFQGLRKLFRIKE